MALWRKGVGLGLAAVMALGPAMAAAQDAQQPQTFTLRVDSNIVLTNVIARDKKTGAVVKDLKGSDFTILENGKPQKMASFDYQNVDQAAVLAEKSTVSGKAKIADLLNRDLAADPKDLRDHRLMVFFFDISSMQPEDIDRAVQSAQDFVNKKMQPADLVALVSLDTGLTMDQDFTADKAALLKGLGKYNGTQSAGFAAGGTTGSTDATADDGSTFAADDSEYAALNTDKELYAIQQIAKSLERVDSRKSMLYFSGGLTRQGIENQASMRAATNEAVKANMAIYSVDSRGLEALPPVGNASTGSLRGTAAYSGASMQSNLQGNFASQETLGTLASDTGGKFFSDSNDFAPVFQQVQHDTEAYYILGFRSTNPARDGSFRHLTVKLNRNDVKLEYRPGYYAPADFQHSKTEDREVQLTEQLRSDLPATDVSVYLQALYFRMEDNRFFVPISLIVPGSQIPFLKNGDKDKATLDVVGQVKNAQGIAVGNIRDTVKLALDAAQQVQRKNIQYSTGFTLAPGRYHLKFVVRENQTGLMGSFETDLNVPDLKKVPMKLSSIVLASQRVPNADKKAVNPLIRDGVEWIPNIPHVFRQDQHLYFLYEVYDPAHQKAETAVVPAGMTRRPPIGGVRVLTSIEFLLGGVKVYETPLVEATAINSPERGAVSFQFDVPLAPLKPGTYVCQVNVIDDAGGSFSFPRLAMQVNAAGGVAPVSPAAVPTAAGAPAPAP
ncbi:VWA domain-containing protein [Granulicella tundricola]|uniref:VWFA-related domain protein n=1 Tax=Granulicella tundricola (strain ATCC BAA-1859 / DSM 23138 / MP5ACTX9) TaxID=1198114 RepID=E8X118_GRATM|nr:VWA domain-containing protein [Granulicella tundricola]ADW67884.1 VWFA-related domain protein [Granulicella tundricola MP5ACTX9]